MRKILHPWCLLQPMLKRCPISHVTVFPHEKDTLNHLSMDCRKGQVQRRELPFNTDHKVPFDCFFTGVGTGQCFGTYKGTRQKQGPPLLRDECHRRLCCDRVLLVQICDLRWGLWLAATRQSPGTQVLCEGGKPLRAGAAVQRVTKKPHRFWSALTESTCELQNNNLSPSRNHSWVSNNVIKQTTAHQICSPKTPSLCWVSTQGRHSKHINDFGQHGALTVIAFTVIVETLKLLQQMYFVVHPGTVVLPFIIYLYLAVFHIFVCFNVCFILVSEGLFLILEGTRLLIWPQARCSLGISLINKSRIKKS